MVHYIWTPVQSYFLGSQKVRVEKVNKEFTKSAREDKNAYIESKCREMEKDKTNSKKAFRIAKEVTGKRSVRTDVINDTEGKALTESMDILKRWEYCGKLYKNQDGDNDNNRLDQRCDYDREPPPLRSEVEWALGNIGNGKAPGMDDTHRAVEGRRRRRSWYIVENMQANLLLLLNLKGSYFEAAVGSLPNFARVCGYRRY